VADYTFVVSRCDTGANRLAARNPEHGGGLDGARDCRLFLLIFTIQDAARASHPIFVHARTSMQWRGRGEWKENY
jgi:hypothetical protein